MCKRFGLFAILLGLGLVLTSLKKVDAQDAWSFRADVHGLYGNYNGSVQRESISGVGVFFKGDYPERGGFTLGFNQTLVDYKAGLDDISQDAVFASGSLYFSPVRVPGRLTARLDLHYIDNDDVTNDTDEVKVFAPQLMYLSHDKRFYADLGYARSDYQNNLEIDQWTPTLGFAFNEDADWLQARGYLIDLSNPSRAQGENDTLALEVKWTHWLGPEAPLGIDSLQASVLIGERIFAVDGDAGIVYNLADVQKGIYSLGAQWKFVEGLSLFLIAGHEKYENQTINDSYTNQYIYLNIGKQW